VFILAAALIVAGVALFCRGSARIGLTERAPNLPASFKRNDTSMIARWRCRAFANLSSDREMGKLSDPDYDSMHRALEDRALTAMAAVEKIRLDADQAANAKKPIVTR